MANEVKITTNDTTPQFLDDKLLVENGVKKRIANPGGDESMVLTLDVINLPLSTTATIADDYFPFYSDSLDENRRMSLLKLGELISEQIDVKDIYMSETDSTPGFLDEKITIPSGYGLAKTITNPNANELLRLVLDIESLETITTYDANNTYMVVYDTTVGDDKPKKLLVPVGSDLSNLPTADQKLALAGTYGSPGNTNRYVTDTDPRMSGLTTTVSGTGVAGETITVGQSLFEEQPITFANTLSEVKLGDVNANKRIAVRCFGSGVATKYFNIAVNNVVSPSVNLNFRIETDSGGSPSGTLVHANAVASLSPSTLSTNYARTTTNTTITTFSSSSTASFGHRIQSFFAQKVTSVTKHASSQATRAILKTDVGNTTIATATFSGNTATFGTDAQIGVGYYRIEFDAAGSNHTYGNGGAHSNIVDTNISILSPSVNGGDSGSNALEIVSISTDNVVLDTRITCTDNFTITRGTPVWIVMYVGTYGSETVNATNHYKIGYSTNISRTRYEKNFNTSWSSTTNKSIYIGNPSSSTGDGVITSMSYSGLSKNVVFETSDPQSLFFSTDGLKMYVGTAGTILQYTLSTAWAVNTATYSGLSVSVSSQESDVQDFYITDDGLKLFTVGVNNDTVYQYNLPTPWAINTATYASKSKSVNAQEVTPRALHFSPDGTKMFIVGTTNDTVYKYTLGTAWDVSTASYASNSISVNAQDANPYGLYFNDAGTKMYILGTSNQRVYEYELTTAWDLTTASYTARSFLLSSEDNDNNTIYFDADFFRMYTTGNNNNYVYQYTLSGRAYTYYDALLESNILALTDADYTYQLPQVPRISQQNKSAGELCQYSLQGVVQWATPLVQNTTYWVSNTPGALSTIPGTNAYKIGYTTGLYQLYLMPFIPYIKTTLTGYVMGTTYTAATDGIVNAYVTNSTTNQTFIGASNGVVLASMNNGAVGGLVQYSICFPVKAGAAWSVSGTMPTNPNIFFTPLSF